MRTTEELMLAAKVREIAIHFHKTARLRVISDLTDGKKYDKASVDRTIDEWDKEHPWRDQLPAALDSLEEIAQLIDEHRKN